MEYKAGPTEFKALGDAGEYEGYFGITGNIDDGIDIIEPGAFKKTIAERRLRIKAFYMHDWEKLLGPAAEVLEEDSRGLYVKGRLTLASFWAREMVWPLLKDGALNEGSIGFETISGKVDYEPSGVRRIRELKLYEYSFVPLGMNPLTSVNAIKALRQYGGDTDAMLNYIVAELKAGARHSRADVTALNTIHDLAVEVGCTNCAAKTAVADGEAELDSAAPAENTEKTLEPSDPAASRAAYEALTRRLLKSRAADLALATVALSRRNS